MSGWKRVFQDLPGRLLAALPETEAGDRIFATAWFLIQHRRLPTRRMLFNDYLHRLKTSNELLDPLRVFVSDKELAKLYVKAVVGDSFNVPTLAVLRSPAEVDDYDFPPSCCIKPTHASGHVILRVGAEGIDRERVKSWFGLQYYAKDREANYRFLVPKVIVEPLLFGRADVPDYKVFCYRGEPRLIQVDLDRYTDHKRKIFDVHWVEQPYSFEIPRNGATIVRPANLDVMLDVAARLSARFSFVRVDLYSDGEKCFVGEVTNCHGAGLVRIIPADAEPALSRTIFR